MDHKTFNSSINIGISLLYTVLFLTGCANSNNDHELFEIKLSESKVDKVVVSSMNMNEPYQLSFFSLIQANNSGLVVTHTQSNSDVVLSYIDQQNYSPCCVEFTPLVEKGRGPGEVTDIAASSKSFNSDTLIFYSLAEAKFILFDRELKLINELNFFPGDVSVRHNFTLGNGKLIISYNPQVNENNKLLKIFDLESNSGVDVIEPRVPVGYEPVIRNIAGAIGSTPNNILVALIGDREIRILDYDGSQVGTIKLGVNDPIGEPFKINSQKKSTRATAYISKIEHYKDHIFVLYQTELLIFDRINFLLKKRIKFYSDIEDSSLSVSDFSVGRDVLYIREGRNNLYETVINPNWVQ
ncbi:hypothetical protein [Gracilimonas sp.]|uniref:hypothetical protein n=1 Tax=Gracilimonas sp. TaxID=1974203 RepID=UPI002870CC46|nr:hypothetical protein [Gracilimonas sp.]